MSFTIGRWRRLAAPLIERTLRDLFAWNPQAKESEARAVLRDVYPFGQRKYHPYKMWLRECKVQLDAHYRPGFRRKRSAIAVPKMSTTPADPNQGELAF